MKKITLLFATLFALTGCEYAINGDLNVNQDFKLDNETYRNGNYDASISIRKTTFAKRYKMTLKVSKNGQENVHTFKAPKGTKIPENGAFNLSAGQLNEKYGLKGEIETDYTTDDRRRRNRESCTYQEPYTVCHSDRFGNVSCHTQYRTVYGHRDVEYYLKTKDQDVQVSIMDGNTAVADFSGQDSYTYRVYTYEGFCGRF